MLNRVISSVILSCSFAVMPIIGNHQGSLLFLFISPNKWVGTVRLALALVAFFISFKNFSKIFNRYPKLRASSLALGLIMIVFGLVSTLEASLGTFFYDYFKPLDLMIILEAGIVITSFTLTTLPKTRPAKSKVMAGKATPKLREKTV